MLYATTRSDHDTFTPERALKEHHAPDGGLYVPMQRKAFSQEELSELLNMSGSAILARILNEFFSCRLTEKDIEFSMGRSIVRLHSMNHRITVAELWHNPDGDFARIQRQMARLAAIDKRSTPLGEWMQTVSRVAALFCVYGQMLRQGIVEFGTKVDTAVLCGSFSAPVAAWYAREMGLPIGSVIVCCNENGAAWDLLQRGEMRTDLPARKTSTPRCDVGRPEGLERLIRLSLGVKEAQRYAFACGEGGNYDLRGDKHERLRAGMYASVVSDKRIGRVIANAYSTNGYILCPYSALTYSGLMDYRAATGKNGPALMISETSPILCEDAVARAMGITVSQLHDRLDIV